MSVISFLLWCAALAACVSIGVFVLNFVLSLLLVVGVSIFGALQWIWQKLTNILKSSWEHWPIVCIMIAFLIISFFVETHRFSQGQRKSSEQFFKQLERKKTHAGDPSKRLLRMPDSEPVPDQEKQ
jgi:phosphate/sulfate permease